ncbi:MAG: hypothetical protein LBD82_06265 [Deltaproteobacteria bacterium]|jgi:hypothetical protein|nr:hypothetical protein [Deltaproteobacteria bacterium]
MTLDTIPPKARYQGNGAATVFPVPFRFARAEDVKVVLTSPDGSDTWLEGDFEVQGQTLIYPLAGAPLPEGWAITIVRQTPLKQETDLENGGAFNAEVVELTFDHLEMQIQENREEIDRSIKLPVTSEENPDDLMKELFDVRDRAEEAQAGAQDARDQALAARDEAEGEADRAEGEADRSEEEADRAEAAADNITNLAAWRSAWTQTLTADLPAGTPLAVPDVRDYAQLAVSVSGVLTHTYSVSPIIDAIIFAADIPSGAEITVEFFNIPISGVAGVLDYSMLTGRPKVNGIELMGDKSGEELGLAVPNELHVSNSFTADNPAAGQFRTLLAAIAAAGTRDNMKFYLGKGSTFVNDLVIHDRHNWAFITEGENNTIGASIRSLSISGASDQISFRGVDFLENLTLDTAPGGPFNFSFRNGRVDGNVTEEVACKCCGELVVVPELMDKLEALRDEWGPIVLTCGHRCLKHNLEVGGAPASQHLKLAFDCVCPVSAQEKFAALAKSKGFTGIIRYPNKGFAHLDGRSKPYEGVG